MLPEAVPELTEEQFEFVKKELERKPNRREIKRLEQAKAIYKKYPVKQ